MQEYEPAEIVNYLEKYIIGQDEAKKKVAIALRNRWRRQQVGGPLRNEILPNNILMIGPTGVGKTEISRRLAQLANAPFVKVEASKFTEVGYMGKDVESMVRNLLDIAINMIKEERAERVEEKARSNAKERVLDKLLPPPPESAKHDEESQRYEKWERTRQKLKEKLENGELDDRLIEVEVPSKNSPSVEVFSPTGMEEMGFNFSDILGQSLPSDQEQKKVTVEEAKEIMTEKEISNLIDMDKIIEEAQERVENNGIIFIDEIDKIASTNGKTQSPVVSRKGVQRDILPLVEGTTVRTKHGMIQTDHILFISAGAFHNAKPSDLIPELQGRLPIRVELNSLDSGDFQKILTEPDNALVKQYKALLESENVTLYFTDGAIEEIAELAFKINTKTEDIGARRLQTVMSTLLEDIMFEVPYDEKQEIKLDKKMVNDKFEDIVKDPDLTKFIL